MNTIEDNLNQRISARIRIERESRGWSLNDLAERAGASRAMIHKIERGESSPTASMLGRLSGAFGISMSTLIARAHASFPTATAAVFLFDAAGRPSYDGLFFPKG